MLKSKVKKSSSFVTILLVIMLALALATISLSACKTAPVDEGTQAVVTESVSKTEVVETSAVENAENPAESVQEEITLKDGLGNEVILEGIAEKIIVFVPSALEILDGIGAIGKVIGVDNWTIDMQDPLAEGMEGFGDFEGLNMEKVAAADPDLIIGLIGWAEEDIKKLEELGIKLYIVDANTVDEVYTEISNMGKITGMDKEAQALGRELKAGIDEIVSSASSLKEDEKPTVFYEVWNDPLMSAGSNTFINELIEYAGGINIVAADGLEGWPEYSIESLIKNNPDVVIAPMSLASDAGVILSDTRFSEINAVKDKRVYIVPDNPVTRPSQNIIKGLQMIAQALHPGIFGEFTVQQ